MDFKDTAKTLISFRIAEINLLLGAYAEVLPDIGCEEVTVDIQKAQIALEVAESKFRINELFPETKEGK